METVVDSILPTVRTVDPIRRGLRHLGVVLHNGKHHSVRTVDPIRRGLRLDPVEPLFRYWVA